MHDYFKDPLVFRTFTFRLGAEIAFVQDYVQENINRLTIPTIVLHVIMTKFAQLMGTKEFTKLRKCKFSYSK